MINHSISNISHTLINKSVNIVYSPHNSLFDNLFKQLDCNIYFYEDHGGAHYYDLFVSNNFLSYHGGLGSVANKNHIKNCLFLHNDPPASFKREDITLAHQNTSKLHKIIFGANLAANWRFNEDKHTTIIEYGLPVFSKECYRNKPLVILNLDNNPNINSLYKHIKSHISDTEIIHSVPGSLSMDEIYSLLSQYKICIDLSNKINTLIAASSGCQCISSQININNKLISYVDNFNNIINIIQIMLSMNLSEDERQHHKHLLTNIFNYDTFTNKLFAKIQFLKNQGFIYE